MISYPFTTKNGSSIDMMLPPASLPAHAQAEPARVTLCCQHKVIKYIYSSTAFKDNLKVFLIYNITYGHAVSSELNWSNDFSY